MHDGNRTQAKNKDSQSTHHRELREGVQTNEGNCAVNTAQGGETQRQASRQRRDIAAAREGIQLLTDDEWIPPMNP
jgi:hypothetical protein